MRPTRRLLLLPGGALFLLGVVACGSGGLEISPVVLADEPFTDGLKPAPVRTDVPVLDPCTEESEGLCGTLATGKETYAFSKLKSDPEVDCLCDVHLDADAGFTLTLGGPWTVKGVGASDAQHIVGPPLLLAAGDGEPELVHSLLERGAHPNGRAEGGLVPLDGALQAGDIHSARLLLEAGADPSLADLDSGVGGRKQEEVLLWLVAHGGDIRSLQPFVGTFMDKDSRRAKLETLLAAGMDVNSESNPLIQQLIHAKEAELVSLVLAKNPDLTLKDRQGKTALQLATEQREDALVSLLRASGAVDPAP